jgi:hypothetical protein
MTGTVGHRRIDEKTRGVGGDHEKGEETGSEG